MKKFMSWLKRGILASLGFYLILLGGSLLDFQMSEEAAYFHVSGITLFSMLYWSMIILMVLTGALGIYLGYKKYKEDNLTAMKTEGGERMKKIGYLLGAASFFWLMMIGGAEFEGPFLKHALIILVCAVFGLVGLVVSACLLYTDRQRKKEDYRLLIEGRKSSLLRQYRRIPALKK